MLVDEIVSKKRNSRRDVDVVLKFLLSHLIYFPVLEFREMKNEKKKIYSISFYLMLVLKSRSREKSK